MHWQARTPLPSDDDVIDIGRSRDEVEDLAHVTLTAGQVAAHSHTLFASAAAASSNVPANNVIAKKARFGVDLFAARNPASVVPMAGAALSPSGNLAPHENMQPYLAINFVIALQGIFPSRN